MQNIISLIFIVSLLSGCSAAGILYTSDPFEKVSNASYLISVNRTLPARKFLLEVMEDINTSETKDEKLTGFTYRALGFLLSSSTYQNYRKEKDNYTTPYDGDEMRGIEFYNKATDVLVKNKFYFEASNVAWLKHISYENQNDNFQACEQLRIAVKYNKLGLKNNPLVNASYSEGHQSFDDEIIKHKKKLRCN
ncbi:hypothetical protein AADZ86_07220 [Colwelliaceae bacterium BS250]